MKYHLFFSILMFSVQAFSATFSDADVNIKDDLFLDKSGTPITGTIERKFPNGKLFLKIETENGKTTQATMYYPNGHKRMQDSASIIAYYHADGTLANEVFRSGNTVVLEKGYYPNKKVAYEIPHTQNGTVGGTVKIYDYLSNTVLEERTYTSLPNPPEGMFNAIRDGLSKVWLPNKNIVSETYENGILKTIGYHDKDGKELRLAKQNVGALPVQVWRQISQDLSLSCNLTKGDAFSGLLILEDGNELLQITCENGVVDGWVRHTQKAHPWLISHTPYKQGKKHGTAIRYGTHDLQIQTLTPYEKGEIEGISYTFFADNQLALEIPYKQSKPNGIIKQYMGQKGLFGSNMIESEIPVKDGLYDGTAKIYDLIGEVIAEITYEKGKEIKVTPLKKEQKSSLKKDKNPPSKQDKKSKTSSPNQKETKK